MKRWFFAICVLAGGCGPAAAPGESAPDSAPQQAPVAQWPMGPLGEFEAQAQSGSALERWLCDFFSAPPDSRPDLLARAPLPFPPGANQVQHRFESRGDPIGDGYTDDRPPDERHRWTIGQRDDGGRITYQYDVAHATRSKYAIDLRIEMPDHPHDSASAQAFLRRFGAPHHEPATDVYSVVIRDTERDEGGGFSPFRISMWAPRGNITIGWMYEQQARFGRRFCQP
ncbi:MAG TPA: hypothetical protein PLK37_06005 [Terricaulis sp.]|nr:hypothetical protein [Terricaulis sp.]